jgi:signal transduction histidine kinase
VNGDPVQLYQLFQNLLSNALKYRGESAPRIEVSAALGPSEWVFTVRDNGIGIAADYHEQIFAMFRRLHPRERYPGTGIGLAICKKIVARHGGRIWVESEPGCGASFKFSLPIGEEAST